VSKVLGLRTVAEFVDKVDVLERLRQIGVDFAQGFLIHRPAPKDEVLVKSDISHRHESRTGRSPIAALKGFLKGFREGFWQGFRG
jgi:sensor c-di-GMP phosphodiesterase-like protein